MQPRSHSLSFAAVDTLSQVLGIDVRLFPFEIPSFGALLEDRERIAKAVLTDLTNRGLIRNNRIDPDVETALRISAEYDVGIGVMGTVEKDRSIRARGAARGNVGVVAVQEGQTIRFDVVGAAGVARGLVDLLPRLGAGPGQSVQIAEPVQPAAGGGFVQAVRAPRSGSDAQLRLAAAMMERPRTGYGFFAVSGRGRHGREISAGTLAWIDTDAGRYLSLTRPQADGAIRATYSPADSGRLMRQLDELIGSVLPR
ncbi:ESX secretion-associated protein EspG [Actinokineospora enzanensis]|uniref:ESX secretion-associated protein EspG n=1 Tax=Actinokineospora enzanensis TaxID=155975 RepID=UPI00035F94FF|nr:ESX secretion-associated protein EspG [Actinokineospora enzanensis]